MKSMDKEHDKSNILYGTAVLKFSMLSISPMTKLSSHLVLKRNMCLFVICNNVKILNKILKNIQQDIQITILTMFLNNRIPTSYTFHSIEQKLSWKKGFNSSKDTKRR